MLNLKAESKKEQSAKEILKRLAAHYPQAATGLNFKTPFQLLIATILSAQTTDEQVNRVTKKLFADFPGAEELASATPAALELYLKSLGLYRNKSRYLCEAAKIISEEHQGQVPADFKALTGLPGVGRKTANVVLSNAFNEPALAVDTHVFRVARRLGLAGGKTTLLVEEELKELAPPRTWKDLHHQLISHGRLLCQARRPKCSACFLEDLCHFARES